MTLTFSTLRRVATRAHNVQCTHFTSMQYNQQCMFIILTPPGQAQTTTVHTMHINIMYLQYNTMLVCNTHTTHATVNRPVY